MVVPYKETHEEGQGMNKKTAVALAVGAMFAAPALAQTGSVQIYGKFYPQFGTFKSSGATQPGGAPSTLVPNPTVANAVDHARRNNVDTSNSYLGFRGNEKLGGSLSLIWQMEQALSFDSPAEFWANRNSFVGFRGGFGTVKLGNMDTIYKEYGDQFSMMGLNSGNFTSASNMLSHIGVGNSGSARFHERRESSVQYETPEFGNFTFGLQYGPDEMKGNPGTTTDASLWSYGVKYESDRLYVSVHQEVHNDFFGGSNNATAVSNSGANASSEDTGTRLSVAYKLTKEHTLTFDIARLEYEEDGQGAAGEFESYKRTNVAIGWEARWGGPFRTGIQFIKANEGSCSLSGGAACSTEGLDGTMLNLGAAYDLSPRTFLFALFSKLKNGESARFDNWPGGSPNRGADTTQTALGIQHRF
jgi:predicted porin